MRPDCQTGRRFVDYYTCKFQKVFSTSSPQASMLEDLIDPCISKLENKELTRVPTEDEIRNELFEINPIKSLDPDGMPRLFYRNY